LLPSRSSGKEKNGVVCDRFRVFVPLALPYPMVEENRDQALKEFKRIYKAVGERLGLPFDAACNDPARFFFPSGEAALEHAWYSDTDDQVDWTLFDFAPENEEKLNEFAPATYSFGEAPTKTMQQKAVATFMRRWYSQGYRNHALFRAARWACDMGWSKAETSNMLTALSCIDALPFSEFNSTLSSAFKKA
jgi:hypothetical protein